MEGEFIKSRGRSMASQQSRNSQASDQLWEHTQNKRTAAPNILPARKHNTQLSAPELPSHPGPGRPGFFVF